MEHQFSSMVKNLKLICKPNALCQIYQLNLFFVEQSISMVIQHVRNVIVQVWLFVNFFLMEETSRLFRSS